MKEQQDRRRCNGGTVGAAVGVGPVAERGGSAFGGAALVDGRTFMAAAVMLAINAFLKEKRGMDRAEAGEMKGGVV